MPTSLSDEMNPHAVVATANCAKIYISVPSSTGVLRPENEIPQERSGDRLSQGPMGYVIQDAWVLQIQ